MLAIASAVEAATVLAATAHAITPMEEVAPERVIALSGKAVTLRACSRVLT